MSILPVNCIRPRQIMQISAVLLHALVWMIYIVYEITLAAAISKKFGHGLDYLLHYALYIVLFYFHCYRLLIPSINDRNITWYLLTVKILMELLVFFSSNVLIYLVLKKLGITSAWSVSSSVFIYSNIYRGLFILGISTGYWFALERITKNKRIHRMQHANAIASKEKHKLRADILKAENNLLKSQVNPHMLFNTLNFIYNEVRKVDKPIADHIMSLSELMHYTLTGPDSDEKVVLYDELEHIEHYIRLYCQRLPLHIELIKEGPAGDFQQKIIPMVLATVLENIFQHGDLTDPGNKGLIHVSNNNGRIIIRSQNKVRPDKQAGHGLGLNNLKKRLEHAYPNSYLLTHGLQKSRYMLELTINLN